MKTKPINSQIEELKKDIEYYDNLLNDLIVIKPFDNSKYDTTRVLYSIALTKLTTLQEAQSQFLEMIEDTGLEDVISFLNNLKDFRVNEELPFGTCDYMAIDDMIFKLNELKSQLTKGDEK